MYKLTGQVVDLQWLYLVVGHLIKYNLDQIILYFLFRGGGTGPADPAAAAPIIYSVITRTKNYHKNII